MDKDVSRWRRLGSYALGIVIETAAVLVISSAALLILLLVKVLMR